MGQKTTISDTAIYAIKGNPGCKQAIADAEGVHLRTVNRWLGDKDNILTKASLVEVIKKHTGLPEDLILRKEQAKEIA